MTAQPDRGRAGDDLIRQLASAYASYRLFPGDTEQPAFRAAAERVARAAGSALAGGPFTADVRSARFSTAAGDVRGDETVDRLGLACFDRRIEQLHVHAVPSIDELAAFSEMLVRPIDEIADRGGAGVVLRALGVTSITVGEIVRGDDEDDGDDLAGLAPDQLLLWERLQDPGALAATLMIEGMPGDAAAAAHDLYVRFRAIEEILPSRLTARRDFFVRIRQVFEHLPQAVAREFHAIVLTRLASERFAMSFGVSLTDQELVDVLFDLAAYGGPDPLDLGRRIVTLTDRKPSVLELIENRRDATASELSTLADDSGMTLTALALARGTDDVRTVVADALAEQLVDAASADVVALRDLFPRSREDQRTLSLAALRDYLAVEDRRVSLERVLTVWATRVRVALAEGDDVLVDRLHATLDAAVAANADVFKRDAVARAVAGVPTPALIRGLLAGRAEGSTADAVAAPLARYGEASLAAVLDLLAVEEEAAMRSALLALAAALAPGHVDVIAERIDDERWYVVRNLVTVLGRGGFGEEAMPTLARLAPHPDPAVRREVVRSLVSCAGAGAVPYLRRLAVDDAAQVAAGARHALVGIRADAAAHALADVVRHGAGTEERRAALDALADHPSAEVPGLLAGLASRRGEQRLPAALRRHAQRLQRSHRRGGRP